MTINELLERARSAAGKQIKYKLGSGGMTPTAPSPANINHECDCSGFVCWALQLRRQTDHPLYVKFNGGWINTDAMVYDGNTQSGFFERLDRPRVGSLIVYPSSAAVKVGHVGIVTALAANGAPAQVIHCSKGNYNTFDDAVRETPPTVFTKPPTTVYLWYAGLEEEG